MNTHFAIQTLKETHQSLNAIAGFEHIHGFIEHMPQVFKRRW